MKMSQMFTQTRREAPAELDLEHYRLLVRAGYIQPLGSAAFALLPLGLNSTLQLSRGLLRRLDSFNPLEINLPLVQPLDLWQNANGLPGTFNIPSGMNAFPVSGQGPALFEIIRAHLRSYRQLPVLLYHSGGAWDAAPTGGGLLRNRAPLCLDFFALGSSPEALDSALLSAFEHFFQECSLAVSIVEAFPEGLEGSPARKWFIPMQGGGDRVLKCGSCGYAAAENAARFRRDVPPGEEPLPLEKVPTPDSASIEALARFLGIPESRTAKAVFLVAEHRRPGMPVSEELVFCVVRGDRPLNETALRNLLQADSLRPAEDPEIRRIGAVPGYASPVGLQGVNVIVDSEIPASPNLVSGANHAGYHLLNVNYGRDYYAARVAEIAQACPGDACPHCGSPLEAVDGAFLGGTAAFPEATLKMAGCTFVNEAGYSRPLSVSRWTLSLTRLLAALAEVHHDASGLVLPLPGAPCPVHLVALAGKNPQTAATADGIYNQLSQAGIETLYDDRPESPGVKFNDADLIGLPLRLTVG